ncbi:Selenocysteine-specific elongation factor [compost metagenome]
MLDPYPPARQRRSAARLAQLQALTSVDSLEQALPPLLANDEVGLDPQRLERQFNRLRSSWELPSDVQVIATRQGPLLFTAARWQALKQTMLAQLALFHQQEPDQLGPDRDRLRRFAALALERPAFISLLDELLASGAIVGNGPWLHLPEHQIRLSDADAALWLQLQPLLEQGRFDPPWVRDLAKAVAQEEAQVRLLLRKLARLGQVHQVVRDLFYPQATIRQMAAMLLQLASDDPVVQVAAFRDVLGIGRKRSVQVLEYFDRIGLTRRMADRRQIRADNALAQSPGE